MKRTLLYRSLIIITLVGLISSCGNSPTIIEEDSDLTSNDTISEQLTEIITQFKMPSPIEVYITLWEDEARFTKEALNPTENVNKYNTTAKKAINLGIYASDVAYCSVYDKNQLTMGYFAASKKLADDLGLAEGFDDKFMSRITDNLDNADSLYTISNESYIQATSYLQNNGQTQLLPYITFGGWIESVHLIISSVKTYNENSTVIQMLNDQGPLLENLVDYFKFLGSNNDIKDIYSDLQSLQDIYDKSLDNESGIISKEQFNEIKSKISEIRSKWSN